MGKILVTGGVGYIGSHTAVELIEDGFEIIIIDDLSNTEVRLLDGVKKITGKDPKFYQLDLKDQAGVKRIFAENEISAVIHFAAHMAVGESVLNPVKYYKNNLLSMCNILENSTSAKIPVVFSSSCTVYGNPEKLPVTEESPIVPAESPYGNTKQIGEEILVDSVKAYHGFKAISLRYFNPIGAHKSGLIGKLPLGVPANLAPYLLQVAIGVREKLNIFGKDYPTPDGTCIRDYIHVVDLAKAHVIALKRLLENRTKENYEVFNLGTGTGYSVLELVQTFERVNNLKLRYEFVDRRPGDVEQIYSDCSFANKELGWKADLTLEDMLKSEWRWAQNLG